MDEGRRQIHQERFLRARVELNNARKLANCRIHDLARVGCRSCLRPRDHPDFERRIRALPADRTRRDYLCRNSITTLTELSTSRANDGDPGDVAPRSAAVSRENFRTYQAVHSQEQKS
jgi:hypothetical protein